MSDETNPSKSSGENELMTQFDKFLSKVLDPMDVRRTIGILFIIILVLNLVAFVFYGSQKQWVDYFDSKGFEALLAALLIPLLMSSVARALKVEEKLKEERRKREVDTIEKTNAMWSRLYTLSTDVAYFKSGSDKASVREIRRKLECFTNSAEEVINLWFLNFGDVALEVQPLVLPGLNLLLLSAATIADVVEDERDEDAKELQNCLLVIQDGVRFGLHYLLMQIFYFEMEEQRSDVKNQTARLRAWQGLRDAGQLFQDLMKDQRPNLSAEAVRDANQKRDAFQADFKDKFAQPKAAFAQLEVKAAQTADPNLKNQIYSSPEYNQAAAAWNKAVEATEAARNAYKQAIMVCPTTLLGLSRKRIFTSDQIRRFTREMYFQSDMIRIRESV